MAVLKRFSYDNIVEHNPTAPDPVEGGGEGGGVFIVRDNGRGQLDKTWSEIYAAADTTVCVLLSTNDLNAIFCKYLMNVMPPERDGEPYKVTFGVPTESSVVYFTMSPDDHPVSDI